MAPDEPESGYVSPPAVIELRRHGDRAATTECVGSGRGDAIVLVLVDAPPEE